MANNPNVMDNLTSLADRTPEEKKKIASAGGKASGEAKRKLKSQREQLEILLSLPLENVLEKRMVDGLNIDNDYKNKAMAMNVAMYNKIINGEKGCVQAYNSFIDILGDRNKERVELENEKLREEINRLKLEQEKLKQEMNMGTDTYEDLTPLVEKLGFKDGEQ